METARGWRRFLPGLDVLLRYDRSWLRGDVLAGLTVCAYLIPQVMAYAQIAGLPAVAGLWGMCAPLVVYALVGPSRQLSVGPESTTALMTAAGVGALVAAVGPGRYADVAAALAIAVGVVCLIGWVARLGFLAQLLSKPVLVGYLTGIAVLMIGSQLGTVTRVPVQGANVVEDVASLLTQLDRVHGPTLALASGTLVALIALHRGRPRWPGPLLVMLAAAAVAELLGGAASGLAVVGPVPAGLPAPSLPVVPGLDVWALVPIAAGIAIVGYSDNVLTARAFAARRHEATDPSQELLALGLINVATAFFHGFPSSSSSSRTVLGDAMGSRTQLHSLVALAGVVAVLLFAGPVLAAFPLAALGGAIIYAAGRLIDVPEIRRIARFRRSELVLAAATAVAVVGFGVLAGIGLAVGLSILNLVRRIARPHDGVLGYVPGLPGMHDVDDYATATQVPGLVVYRYDAPLVFANAENFLARALRAIDHSPTPVEWFVLNVEANVEVDLTSVDTLAELRDMLRRRGIEFALARVKQDLRVDLAAAGLLDDIPEDRLFATLPAAVTAYAAWYAERHGHRPGGLPEGFPQVL
nr:STAS domain-containing protein [Propionibacterium sp.]